MRLKLSAQLFYKKICNRKKGLERPVTLQRFPVTRERWREKLQCPRPAPSCCCMQLSYRRSLIFLDFRTVFYRRSTSFRNGQYLCRPEHGKVSWKLIRILLWYIWGRLEPQVFLIPVCSWASLECRVFSIVNRNKQFLCPSVGKRWGSLSSGLSGDWLTVGPGCQPAPCSKAYFGN